MTTFGVIMKMDGRDSCQQFKYESVTQAASYLLDHTNHRPKVGIVCGSGLGGLAEELKDTDAFHYKDIPNFPVSTVPGHAGRLVFGTLGGKETVCMQGRMHLYEGYPLWKVTFPIRVMKELGVTTVIITNAAGGLNRGYNVGDVMLIRDHVNLMTFGGNNPLIGLSDQRFGQRFVALSQAYDQDLRKLTKNVAKDLGFEGFVREGVLSIQGGPSFETVAECRLLTLLGADATGMSVVPEVIVSRQCGIRVMAMSLITNMCVMDYDTTDAANHEEVLETGKARANDLQQLVSTVVEMMSV